MAVLLRVVALSVGPRSGMGAGSVRVGVVSSLNAEPALLVTMIQY